MRRTGASDPAPEPYFGQPLSLQLFIWLGASIVKDVTLRRLTCRGAWRPAFLTFALAGMASLALALVAGQPTRGQPADRPHIRVARTITAQPATAVAFPIQVGQVPPNSFVRVRGLPPMAALSEGHAISPGVWAVPLNVLAHLTITLPATAMGSADVVVALIGRDGSVLVETRCTLVIAALPPPTPYDRERALQFLEKGNAQLAQGLIAPARLLYERAADLGLAEAALALARTYDAAELERLQLRGIQPDTKEARRWYERALALGAPDAEQRLKRLGRE